MRRRGGGKGSLSSRDAVRSLVTATSCSASTARRSTTVERATRQRRKKSHFSCFEVAFRPPQHFSAVLWFVVCPLQLQRPLQHSQHHHVHPFIHPPACEEPRSLLLDFINSTAGERSVSSGYGSGSRFDSGRSSGTFPATPCKKPRLIRRQRAGLSLFEARTRPRLASKAAGEAASTAKVHLRCGSSVAQYEGVDVGCRGRQSVGVSLLFALPFPPFPLLCCERNVVDPFFSPCSITDLYEAHVRSFVLVRSD
jgi:hypothetical protein